MNQLASTYEAGKHAVAVFGAGLPDCTGAVQAALDAPLPAGCSRTVYLCDDGKNKQKRKWCLGRAPEVVYVSGRQRPKGEMNGKSANLNNCLRQVYPENAPVPANEIVCIFDADQVRPTGCGLLTCKCEQTRLVL